MNKPVVVCFSHNNNNLDHIICELNKYYSISIDQITFNNEQALIESLNPENYKGAEIKLLVIDVNDSTPETIDFIRKINKLCPVSFKLIIANEHNLENIQYEIKDSSNIQYLNHPWSSTLINYALKLALHEQADNEKFNLLSNEELLFNELVEEKVNERLQKLIDSNRAKDSFLSIIAHDLKSPFNVLLGFSEILINDWEMLAEEEKLELINDINRTSNETFKLLQNLVEWAKSQKEKLEVTVHEILIHSLVDTTIKVAETKAASKGVTIENTIDDKLTVNADKNQIATVFRNLISNAVTNTQAGGKINISAKNEQDFYTFCIEDNGTGIDKPHILEVFKKGNTKKLNGNAKNFKGLGLVICKDFVEKNGGKIWLETKKGEGTKFYFTIPN